MANKIYADISINWEFIFEVIYEDDCIIVLKNLGRFHRYDTSRMWCKPIDGYFIDFISGGTMCVTPDGKRKLYEVTE